MSKKPSKQLVGRCVKVMKCQANQTREGSEGVVTRVDDDGLIHVHVDSTLTLQLQWETGDRWTIIANI